MAKFDKTKSMVEIAVQYVKENGKQNIYTLLNEVAKIKELSENDMDKLSQLYLDMTLNANFVYCGNDEWDLKENNLDLWDKDGSFFNKDEPYEEEDDDDIQLEDYFVEEEIVEAEVSESDEDDEEFKLDEDEEEIVIDDHVKVYSTDDEDEVVDLDFDDDDYNKIMDDYEDMYDE